MKLKPTLILSATVVATVFAGLAGGCGDDDAAVPAGQADAGTDTNQPPPPPPPPPDGGNTPLPTAKRPSKAGTIAISDDDQIVGMVNPEDNSVSFFKTADNSR